MVENRDGTIVITGDVDIRAARMLTLRRALMLEIKGIRVLRRTSVSSIIKKEYSIKGNKETLLKKFEAVLTEEGIPFLDEKATR